MKIKSIIKSRLTYLLMVILVVLLYACGSNQYEISEMKFKSLDKDTEVISSSNIIRPIAGNEDFIIYMDQVGNIVCFNCETNMEKILVAVTSPSPEEDEYASIILDGRKVYYREFSTGGQYDTVYCVDIDSGRRSKVDKIYMDSPFYIENGEFYCEANIQEQLNILEYDKYTGDPLKDYYFDPYTSFIICNRMVYQQVDNMVINIFDLDSELRSKIPCSDFTYFCITNNNIYYVQDKEFGELKDNRMLKIIDLKNIDVTQGTPNVQIIGEYVALGNDTSQYIYNMTNNTLEESFEGCIGPYMVNGQLVYWFLEGNMPPDYFTEIGQGYYSLNIEKAIKSQ